MNIDSFEKIPSHTLLKLALTISAIDLFFLKDVIITNFTSSEFNLLTAIFMVYLFQVFYSALRLYIRFNICDPIVGYLNYVTEVISAQSVILIAVIYFYNGEDPTVTALIRVVYSLIAPWCFLAFSLDYYMSEIKSEGGYKPEVPIPSPAVSNSPPYF
eukprot:CAMPEP_0168336428 /NCGR_PEP_ID=MMETSP0213-20121227/11535_1 /TAXON_ID=151035 /ORGANISM="Euplotes harpa, Strain FSP1.4" /LENGTH=157 /DNA_ID=CAMNT_0008341617 /DNA_START=8 /DNA_END=481 /DNA_ORIENTATION=-